jgi:hypothetical protein
VGKPSPRYQALSATQNTQIVRPSSWCCSSKALQAEQAGRQVAEHKTLGGLWSMQLGLAHSPVKGWPTVTA